MNEIIIKRTFIFSLVFGAFVGILSVIPPLIGFSLFCLMFLSAPVIIIYMKKNEKYLSYINNEQGAILGAVIGFSVTVGFFASFTPLICIIGFIFKNYHAYGIPYLLSIAPWMLLIIVFFLGLIFASTNAASAMGLTWIYSHVEQKPDENNSIDIKIED